MDVLVTECGNSARWKSGGGGGAGSGNGNGLPHLVKQGMDLVDNNAYGQHMHSGTSVTYAGGGGGGNELMMLDHRSHLADLVAVLGKKL